MKQDTIQMAHGGGGRLTRELIEQEIVPRFGQGPLAGLPDGAKLPAMEQGMIYTTDSFVVHPLEFPGGNIGDLAVHGTVNDIAVSGGRPKWLSVGLILEEGLKLELLRRVLDSLREAASECGAAVVTGDTKVVGNGQCDGIYINTSGIGEVINGYDLDINTVKEGDAVLISGSAGDHGMAVLACREGIDIENGPESDTGPVHRLVQAVPDPSSVRFMRDPTRGGLATVLNEIVEKRQIGISLNEQDLPFSPGTRAVSEMLGLDPMQSASEGRLIAVCDPTAAGDILEEWKKHPEGEGACKIGDVTCDSGKVILNTFTGGRRLVDVPRGEILPRIC